MVQLKAPLLLLCASASAQNLCSDINTSDSSPNTDQYQSTGQCTGVCKGKFAYAVLQSSSCWCTNYTPGKSSQKNGCNIPCPGYPDNICGGENLYSYTLLNQDLVLGSKGGSGSTADSGTSQTPTPTVKPTAAATFSPIVTTVNGVVSTVTVVPTTTVTPEPTTANGSSGLTTSALVGVVFGCLGGLAVVGLCIWFFLFRRKGGDDDNDRQMFVRLSPMRSGGARASMDSIDNLSNPFSDSRVSPFSHSLYSWRNRAGSIEYRPEKDGGLRIVNPDPPEKP